MGLDDLYEFRLVAEDAQPPISTASWPTMQHRILHMQPARSAVLEGNPPRSIRIEGFGETDVAPALLADLERLAMTRLHIEVGES
jgi:hypothetical protein